MSIAVAQSSSTRNVSLEPTYGVHADPVKEAADKIQKLIDSEGWNEWADQGEVIEASNILAKLQPATADAVVDELHKRGILDDFAREVVDTSWVGPGLSKADRAQLFANFAVQLDAGSLGKVIDAFRGAANPQNGEAYAQELAGAIKQHTKPSIVSDLTVQLAQQASSADGSTRDPNLSLAADLLSSLKGRPLYDALKELKQDGNLNAVLNASVNTEYHTTWEGKLTHVTQDTSAFEAIMDHVSRLKNASMKKDVFAEGVRVMQRVDNESNPAVEAVGQMIAPNYNDAAANRMALSLTRILDSDAEGVMHQINYTRGTFYGEEMTAYAKQMLEAGATEDLSMIFKKLKFGNDLKGDPAERMEEIGQLSNGTEVRPHADVLGYFVGAVRAGAAQISDDQAQQIEYATAVIKAAFTAVDKSKVGGNLVGSAFSMGKEGVGISLKLMADPKDAVARQWLEASIPFNPIDGMQAISSDAIHGFESKMNYIYARNVE